MYLNQKLNDMKTPVTKFDNEFNLLFNKLDEAIEENENNFPGSTQLGKEHIDESIHELVEICNDLSDTSSSEFIVFT